MLVARVYTVMDTVVVEVSCVHPRPNAGSHLLVREERRGLEGSRYGLFKALEDVAGLASWVAAGQGSVEPGAACPELRVDEPARDGGADGSRARSLVDDR